MTPPRVLLVGTGPMAQEYARLLREGLNWDFVVASRDPARAASLAAEWGAVESLNLDRLAEEDQARFDFGIVATSFESLASVTERLLKSGIKHILLEKPGSTNAEESLHLHAVAEAHRGFVRVAYNRRYYASIRGLKGLLKTQPPLCGFFDFTEWASIIEHLPKSDYAKGLWGIGNSIHVIDTVLYLLGPLSIDHSVVAGGGALSWHPSGSTYVGTGTCGTVPVSWCTCWEAPGRWNIEIVTATGRFKLSPMERLQVLRHRETIWVEALDEDALDAKYKPGLYRMVLAFYAATLGKQPCELPTLQENAATLRTVAHIMGY